MRNNHYLSLLIKQLSGEISPEEEAQLLHWRSESAENEKIAREYEMLWEKSGGYTKQFAPDLDAAFARVQGRIQSAPEMQVRVFNIRNLMRAAAAVAILALSVWGYTRFTSAPELELMASAGQNGKEMLTLSDGSRVWLRQGSSLHYSDNYTGKKERRVKLAGEAYFEVAHDPQHPFKVELADGASVEVLGTEFDIRESQDQTSVLVRSGKVRFSTAGNARPPVLTANQKAVFNKKTNTLKISHSLSLNELSWQTGGLEFIKTPLSQVVEDLQQYYGVKIALKNAEMADCPHSAPLTNNSLDDVLEALSVAHGLKVSRNSEGVYELSGGSCPN